MASLGRVEQLVRRVIFEYDESNCHIAGLSEILDELSSELCDVSQAESVRCCEPRETPASCCAPKPSACCVPCPSGYFQVPVLPGYQTVITITDAASLPCED